eukprot:SAG22_NODE_6423_length_857_cov_1.829815_2_plen_206_part_00
MSSILVHRPHVQRTPKTSSNRHPLSARSSSWLALPQLASLLGCGAERSYGLQKSHCAGFPRELLAAVLGNGDVVNWVAGKSADSTRFVWRSLSQDDLEEFMRVSVGPGGQKLDMRGTQIRINRRCIQTSLRLDTSSLVHAPVSKKGAYARDDKRFLDRWNTSSRTTPPLGGFTDGERDIRKKAEKSAAGTPMFRSALFKRRFATV